jgi:hypothetical protein
MRGAADFRGRKGVLMTTTKHAAMAANGASAPAGIMSGTGPGVPAAEVGTPAPKTRHGLYFFLMFVLPLVALFVFALLRGNE